MKKKKKGKKIYQFRAGWEREKADWTKGLRKAYLWSPCKIHRREQANRFLSWNCNCSAEQTSLNDPALHSQPTFTQFQSLQAIRKKRQQNNKKTQTNNQESFEKSIESARIQKCNLMQKTLEYFQRYEWIFKIVKKSRVIPKNRGEYQRV